MDPSAESNSDSISEGLYGHLIRANYACGKCYKDKINSCPGEVGRRTDFGSHGGVHEEGMTPKIFRLIESVASYLKRRIKAMKAFWKFVKNPRGELKGTKARNDYPEVLRHPIYGNHNFIQLPGVKLHYVESGSRNQELLIFVHGFPDFWFSWKHQIAYFSKDYWVIALDMRGYGDTERRREVFFYKIDFLVNDIRNLVLTLDKYEVAPKICFGLREELKSKGPEKLFPSGREKFTLIAHDWGGVVAHYFIRIHPEMVNKYVLMNTVFHPKLGDILYSDVKQFLKSWYILILQIPYYAEYFFLRDDLKNLAALYEEILSPEEVEIYKFMFGSYDKIKGPINYYRANFKDWRTNGIPSADNLNKRNLPGLYIHGEDDIALTLNMAFTKSFEDIQNVQLACVPNAGHFVHMHSPEKVNEIISNFLGSVCHP